MNRFVRFRTWPAAMMLLAVICSHLCAQEDPAPRAKQPFRRLAPGVVREIDTQRQLKESFSRHDIVELLAVDSKFDWAKQVPFRRDIWALEFKFKPVRMIWVDMPQPGGKMQRKQVWYMIYCVTNPGKTMHPVVKEDGTCQIEFVAKPLRFIPEFLLEAPEFNKAYPDRVIPVALGPIRMREDRNRKFLTSVEMCRDIKVGETLWGVATWEDLDPRIDRFSIYVQGLTNAYVWKDEEGRYKKGDPIGTGRRLSRKTLKLNFWRPGDEFFEHEQEIRFGIPGEVDYDWVYR